MEQSFRGSCFRSQRQISVIQRHHKDSCLMLIAAISGAAPLLNKIKKDMQSLPELNASCMSAEYNVPNTALSILYKHAQSVISSITSVLVQTSVAIVQSGGCEG